jgi:hypothetical protein
LSVSTSNSSCSRIIGELKRCSNFTGSHPHGPPEAHLGSPPTSLGLWCQALQ